MNTFLSSAQESLKAHYQEFAREKVAPVARALESHAVSLKEFLQTLGQSGYLWMTVPQAYGGQGAAFLNVALLVEALCEFEPGLGLTMAGHTAVVEVIKKYGSQAQKQRYLPLLARGELVGSFAVSEEAAGSDFKAVKMVAVKGADALVLTGKKVWVVNAAMQGLMIVLVRLTAPDGESGQELALLIVDLSASDKIKISDDRSRLGLRSACANDVELEGQWVPAENLLKAPEDAAEQVLWAMDVAKVIVAASAVGLTQAALDHAVRHARTREQFGKNIGQFQGIQWKLADHAVEAEGARLQTYRAAWAKDDDPRSFRRFAAMCKWYGARAARVYSGEALQVLASFGISAESPLERFYRDAKVMEICEGTSEFQKVLLVDELEI